jgi:hypothetical protein
MGLFVIASWVLTHSLAWVLAQRGRVPVATPPDQAAPVTAAPAPVGVWRALRRLRVALE